VFSIQVGRLENAIGWYHSHPGYGCWLSGIDVSTQMLNQNFQEPFVAIVIDPVRTISAGKVNLGAFRTYPKGYKAANDEPSEYQTIPLNKIEDFGVHCKHYYSLDVTYFKSSLDRRLLDSLWNRYWVNTLGSSSLQTVSVSFFYQIPIVINRIALETVVGTKSSARQKRSVVPPKIRATNYHNSLKKTGLK